MIYRPFFSAGWRQAGPGGMGRGAGSRVGSRDFPLGQDGRGRQVRIGSFAIFLRQTENEGQSAIPPVLPAPGSCSPHVTRVLRRLVKPAAAAMNDILLFEKQEKPIGA